MLASFFLNPDLHAGGRTLWSMEASYPSAVSPLESRASKPR
jgi:hypothetical protein